MRRRPWETDAEGKVVTSQQNHAEKLYLPFDAFQENWSTEVRFEINTSFPSKVQTGRGGGYSSAPPPRCRCLVKEPPVCRLFYCTTDTVALEILPKWFFGEILSPRDWHKSPPRTRIQMAAPRIFGWVYTTDGLFFCSLILITQCPQLDPTPPLPHI